MSGAKGTTISKAAKPNLLSSQLIMDGSGIASGLRRSSVSSLFILTDKQIKL
jgi:hypothetical protein